MANFPNSLTTVTRAPGTNTTDVATCAFVLANGGGGGGGAPGGADTQVQYNSGGAFAGSAGFTFDATARAARISAASGDYIELDSNAGAGPALIISSAGSGAYANIMGGGEAWLNFTNASNSTGHRWCRYGSGNATDTFALDLLTDDGLGLTTAGIVSFSVAAPASSLVVDASGVIHGDGSGLTFTAPVNMASHYGPITADADGATITFNLATSDKHTVTLGGNRTLALSNAQVGQQFVLILVQDATGSRTVTWFSGITWMTAAGAVPALSAAASKINVFTFLCVSAGAYYGFLAGQNG